MDGRAHPEGFHPSVAPVSNLIATSRVEKEQSVLKVKERILYSCFNLQSQSKGELHFTLIQSSHTAAIYEHFIIA